MTSGISIFSAAIEASRAFSSARSGDAGAYVLVGSFTGSGTLRTPAKAAFRTMLSLGGGAVAVEPFSAGAVGACVDMIQL